MAVEGAYADTGVPRHVARRHVHAAGCEQLSRRRDETLTVALRVAACGLRRDGHRRRVARSGTSAPFRSSLGGCGRRVRLLERLLDRRQVRLAVGPCGDDDQRPVLFGRAARYDRVDLRVSGVDRLLAVELNDHRNIGRRLLTIAIARDEERARVPGARTARESLRDLRVVLAAGLEARV